MILILALAFLASAGSPARSGQVPAPARQPGLPAFPSSPFGGASAGRLSGTSQDLSLEWLVTETERFRVIFPGRLSESAAIVRREAEEVLTLLVSWGGLAPPGKIDIVLSDSSDYANGFTQLGTRGYYLVLYAVEPFGALHTGLDSAVEWYRSLLIHELSHLLHLQEVNGFTSVTRAVFGYSAHPNSATPLFYREGFATYAETVNADFHGRGNSPFTDMYVRASVEEDRFLSLDRASNAVDAWPGSQGPYLFGVSFLNYLSALHGEEKIHEFNRKSGGCIMYLWNIPFRSVFGMDMHDAWRGYIAWEGERQADLLGLMSGGDASETSVSPAEALFEEKGHVYSVALDHPGGRVFYSMRRPGETGGLYLLDLETGRVKLLERDTYARNIVAARDGARVFYLRTRVYKNVYVKSDLYVYDIRRGRERRISRGGGIQAFAFLEDRESFLVSRTTPGGVVLSEMDAEGGTRDLLDSTKARDGEGALFAVVEDVALSPSGGAAAFSCRTEGGDRAIYTASLAALEQGEGGFTRVTRPGFRAYDPQWMGDHELLFIGDEGGVYNLHAIDLVSGGAKRVTSVSTGLLDVSLSGSGVAALKEYTAGGYRVSLCTVTRGTSPDGGGFGTPAAGAATQQAAAGDVAGGDARGATGANDAATPAKYRPWRWVPPGAWLPLVVEDGSGLGPGVWTWGSDVLGRHSYEIKAYANLYKEGMFELRADYLYSARPFSYFLSFSIREEGSPGIAWSEFAIHPGMRYLLRRERFTIVTDLGLIAEDPFLGPDLLFSFNNLKTPKTWMGPERGVAFVQQVFANLEGEDFLVLGDAVSVFVPILGFSTLELSAAGRAGFGGPGEFVISGASSRYEYAPLDGIYTVGYPDPVVGKSVLDMRAELWAPLLEPERGIRTFPLFLQGIAAGGFVDSGLVFSESGSLPFLVDDLDSFLEDPARYLRTSLGLAAKAGFLAGYEFPLGLVAGYAWALSEGGRNGFFGYLEFGVAF